MEIFYRVRNANVYAAVFNAFFDNDFAQMFLEFAGTAPLFSSLASAPVKPVTLGRVFRRWFGLGSRSLLVLLFLLLDSLL